MDESPTFQLSELELIVLNAYFLALPLPPLLSGQTHQANTEGEAAIQEATQSLLQKGWIYHENPDDQDSLIIPALAQSLRAMAYANQMVHLFIQDQEAPTRQIAFYHDQGFYIQHELRKGSQHKIQTSQDLGLGFVRELLQGAPEGTRGENADLPLEAWHLLLSSLNAGNNDEILANISSSDHRSDRGSQNHRQELVKDILKAQTVIELTSVYDRLDQKQEKAAFILGKETNWLGMISNYGNGQQEKVYALQVPQQNLIWAAESIFATLNSSIKTRGRSA